MVTFDAQELDEARSLLGDVVATTPMEHTRWLSDRVGGQAWMKCENLQRAGSFKIRGAYVRISRMSPEQRARGVVAASAGNHAQGVALAGSMLDTKTTVFMPESASLVKERATKAYGAEVRFTGADLTAALAAAQEFAAETGAELIHPFDHADIVRGQASVGLEILEQVPDVRTIVVGTGGGGLLAGIAAAVHAHRPDVSVVGVQAAGAAAYPPSLAAGAPTSLEDMTTIADGIAVGRPGDTPFALVRELVERVDTVGEEDLSRALLLLLERAKLVVEPAGAASVAGVLRDPERFTPPVVTVLSGGNIDPLLLLRVIRHGLAADGRYLSFRASIPDRPGGLAALLTDLAELGANVLDVVHERTRAALGVDEVDVALQLETRGEEHQQRVLERIHSRGYRIHLTRSA